jgi:hypothetical protein
MKTGCVRDDAILRLVRTSPHEPQLRQHCTDPQEGAALGACAAAAAICRNTLTLNLHL